MYRNGSSSLEPTLTDITRLFTSLNSPTKKNYSLCQLDTSIANTTLSISEVINITQDSLVKSRNSLYLSVTEHTELTTTKTCINLDTLLQLDLSQENHQSAEMNAQLVKLVLHICVLNVPQTELTHLIASAKLVSTKKTANVTHVVTNVLLVKIRMIVMSVQETE